MHIGLGVSEDLPLDEQRAIAREVEAAGLTSLWTNEARGRDALLQCHTWAQVTERLEVGVAVLPIWTRSPAQIAMGAATLQEASAGRFHLGLGVSHPGTMGPWHHANFRRPLTAAAECLQVLGQLLSGETSDVEGEVLGSRRFRLGITPMPQAPRIHLGAMGPRMIDLAGQSADGAFLNWSGPDEVRRATQAVASAAKEHGRTATTTTYVRIAVDPDRGAARESLAREFSTYAALPAYASHFERQGLGRAVAALKQAHREGSTPGQAVADDELGAVGWWGTPDQDPSEALEAYRSAGLDHLVARVVVVGDSPATSVRNAMRALARAN